MRPLQYRRATGVEDAIDSHRRAQRASYLAGGTTLIDLVKLDVMRPEELVDINKLPFNAIEEYQGGLRIGANVRNSDLAWDERVKCDYQALSEALLSGASPQLRNMATVGGNLMQRTRCPYFRDNYSACNKREPGSGCAAMEGFNRMHAVLGGSNSCVATHPSDMCVALAIFDAKVIVKGKDGEREIDILDFHLLPGDTPDREHALQPGELITAVVLPPVPEGTHSMYLKSRDRASYEFALASAAVMVGLKDGAYTEARVALGGVGTKPWRSREAENELLGMRPSQSAFRKAAEAAMASAQPLERNAFKIPLARGVIERALSEATRANQLIA